MTPQPCNQAMDLLCRLSMTPAPVLLLAADMGITTLAVQNLRDELEAFGYEILGCNSEFGRAIRVGRLGWSRVKRDALAWADTGSVTGEYAWDEPVTA